MVVYKQLSVVPESEYFVVELSQKLLFFLPL